MRHKLHSAVRIITAMTIILFIYQGCAKKSVSNTSNLSNSLHPRTKNTLPTTYPHCTTDKRSHYTTIEVPEITNIGQAPPEFFALLHAAILEEGRARDIYHVVPTADKNPTVIQLIMFVESWTPKTPKDKKNGVLAMQLLLIDQVSQCQVGQTTGYGNVGHNPTNGFDIDALQTIAQSAGWFVGITLMHDPE